jgi:hypothetical protein
MIQKPIELAWRESSLKAAWEEGYYFILKK